MVEEERFENEGGKPDVNDKDIPMPDSPEENEFDVRNDDVGETGEGEEDVT